MSKDVSQLKVGTLLDEEACNNSFGAHTSFKSLLNLNRNMAKNVYIEQLTLLTFESFGVLSVILNSATLPRGSIPGNGK